MVIGETLAHQARVIPDREALVVDERRLTWRQLDAGANRFANALLGLGARHGDRVVLLLGNCVEFVEAYYGLAKIGCISAPVMPRAVASEVTYVAERMRAKFIVAEAGAAHLVREMTATPATRSPATPTVQAIGVGAGHGLALDYDTLLAAASDAEPQVEVAPDDLLTVKFTGGTTGIPKGCVRTHRNFIMAAAVTLAEIPLTDDETALIATPLAAGMAISQLTMLILKGSRIVMMRRFEPGEYLETLARERPTLGYLMDIMSRRLAAHPGYHDADFSCMRLLHGVNATDVLHKFHEQKTFRAGLTSGYASSECGGLVSFKKPDYYSRALADPSLEHLLDSVGREAPLSRVEIVDDDGKLVPHGELGELAVRGPSVFQGYWEMPEETAKVLRGGWLYTGDVGFRDKDGDLYLRGRKREMIKSGGLSVYPAEVEPVLLTFPKISEVAVVGIPHQEWGEQVVACVVASPDCSADEIMAWCDGKLASYKRPKEVVFFQALPVSEAGKLMKKELIKILVDRAAS
jgi:acyl-CoA synthetase (AMP-forming)/AMP-acid ligase II